MARKEHDWGWDDFDISRPETYVPRFGNFCGPGYPEGDGGGDASESELGKIPPREIPVNGVSRDSPVDQLCKDHDTNYALAAGKSNEAALIQQADRMLLRDAWALDGSTLSREENEYRFLMLYAFLLKDRWMNTSKVVAEKTARKITVLSQEMGTLVKDIPEDIKNWYQNAEAEFRGIEQQRVKASGDEPLSYEQEAYCHRQAAIFARNIVEGLSRAFLPYRQFLEKGKQQLASAFIETPMGRDFAEHLAQMRQSVAATSLKQPNEKDNKLSIPSRIPQYEHWLTKQGISSLQGNLYVQIEQAEERGYYNLGIHPLYEDVVLGGGRYEPPFDCCYDGCWSYGRWYGGYHYVKGKNEILGYLVYDKNSDGVIADLDEVVFIDETQIDFYDDWKNIGMAVFDTNQDGKLDHQDTTWSQFGLWNDRNTNWYGEADEFVSLAEWQIQSISLDYETIWPCLHWVAFSGPGHYVHQDDGESDVLEVTRSTQYKWFRAWEGDVARSANNLISMQALAQADDGGIIFEGGNCWKNCCTYMNTIPCIYREDLLAS